MLESKQLWREEAEQGLLGCCDRRTHLEMLLHQDEQLQQEVDHIESKQATTDSCVSFNGQIFPEKAKRTHRHKISLSQRRNSNNQDPFSKKQGERLSIFHPPQQNICKMTDQHAQFTAFQLKNENTEIDCLPLAPLKKQNKTSLKQNKQNSTNRPYLVQFSFIDGPWGNKDAPIKNNKISIKRDSYKNQPATVLPLKENNAQNTKILNLKLGQNLPTYRSQFHNTTETFTKRSEVL